MMKSLSDLKNAFKGPLPGREAHLKMMPPMRHFELPDSYREAGVIILFFERRSELFFLLIRRAADGHTHSYQMGLPGGNCKRGEGVEEAALRELSEEVGIDSSGVDLLCQLTSLPIPVSGFMVHPFVATIDELPCWSPQEREVEEVYEVALADLLDRSNLKVMTKTKEGIPENSPYYFLNGQRVWGATAMILSELVELFRS